MEIRLPDITTSGFPATWSDNDRIHGNKARVTGTGAGASCPSRRLTGRRFLLIPRGRSFGRGRSAPGVVSAHRLSMRCSSTSCSLCRVFVIMMLTAGGVQCVTFHQKPSGSVKWPQ
ncbi:hypothetical protein GCM10010156_34660 [Planobispora rosea]|uniref:Uncharacterized protein n=1 Tax=Planobispora rosea TaxID=35762 RepID=A0A8J3S363_PLARO|nr:hypothetical protein GCM10010156_34660 [Planobispora rosea]GIH85330.1 hypothetical protein Pro02_37380 [Planobispora rosea]